MLLNFFQKQSKNAKNDILSGITVALALVPEAVAFAFIANVDPVIGLYGAFMVGLVTSIFGGRPGMISGATGALAVVMVHLVKEAGEMYPDMEFAGLQFLFATLILMGAIQFIAGLLKLGKFIRLVPHSVMLGFVNGLAIVIFLSQISMFKLANGDWMNTTIIITMLGLVAVTMAIMYFLPKITKIIPSGLVAIVVVTLIVVLFKVDTPTVLSFVQSKGGTGIEAGLPVFNIPVIPLTLESLKFIFPYALILAAIGLIESLLTLTLIDDITDTKGNANKECMAQGAANVVNGFFGGMGGCAMIGQSMINVNGGGRGRLSGVVASLALLSFILFLSKYIEVIPIAALVGVMFMVVIGTFEWASLRMLRKIPLSDAIIIVLVTGTTVVFDLAIAVAIGVIVAALVFAWQNAIKIRAKKYEKDSNTFVYEIWGPLFFGSSQNFISKFDFKTPHATIVIDFIESKVTDNSGVEAILTVIEKFGNQGKKVILKHLSQDCQKILIKSNAHLAEIIEEAVDDPRYFVVSDTFE